MNVTDKVILGQDVQEKKLPQLLSHIERLEGVHERHLNFAKQIGLNISSEQPPSKKARKNKK